MTRLYTRILCGFALLFPFALSAQLGQDNLDFENWTINSLDTVPSGFPLSFDSDSNVSDPQNGNAALHLETRFNIALSDTFGQARNWNFSNVWGEPYSKRPDSVSGYVRYKIPDDDIGIILFRLTSYDASTDSTHIVGTASLFPNSAGFPVDTIQNWTKIKLPFNYDTCMSVDTLQMVMGAEIASLYGPSYGSSTIGGEFEADNFKLHTPAPQISKIVTSPDVCQTGPNEGSIEVQASNVDSCSMYSIDGGASYQNDSIFTSLDSGDYEVIVNTANGSDTMMAMVGDSVNHTIDSVDVTNADCGLANGSFTIHASGGVKPYQFSNDSGSTYKADSNFTGLSSGIYDIAVKDDNGCIYHDQVSVGTISTLSIDSISMEKEACGMNDGKMTVHASGGTKPYTFSIDGGAFQTDSTFTGLSAGDHDLTVQDANTCTDDSLNVYLDSVMAPTISGVNVTDATCGMSDGEIEVNASGGQGSLMYSNDGGSNYQGGFTFSGLSTGMYKTMVKDTNGCKDSMTVEVDTNLVPMAMAASDTDSVDLANSGTVNFDGSGSQGNTLTWYFGDGSSGSGMNVSHTYDSTGTFNVWLVAEAGNCVDSSMVTIDVVNTSSIAGNKVKNPGFEVRPNPSSGRFQVEMDRTRNGSIKVLDVTGRVVHTESIDATHRSSIDMSDEEEGVYFLRLIDKNGKAIGTQRLILAD